MGKTAPDIDVLLVGGGHNGLVCAAYLARAGLKVTVIERRGVAGGAAVRSLSATKATGAASAPVAKKAATKTARAPAKKAVAKKTVVKE